MQIEIMTVNGARHVVETKSHPYWDNGNSCNFVACEAEEWMLDKDLPVMAKEIAQASHTFSVYAEPPGGVEPWKCGGLRVAKIYGPGKTLAK